MRGEPLPSLAPLRLQQAGELLAMRAERLDAFAEKLVDAAGVFGDRGDGGVAMFAHARLEGRESALQRLAHALALRADIGRDELRRRPDLVLEFGEARDDRLARRGFALHHGRRDGLALAGDDFLEGGELVSDERAGALAALGDPRAGAFAAVRNLRARALAVLGNLRGGAFDVFRDLRARAFAVLRDLRAGAFAVLQDSRAGAFDVLEDLRAGAFGAPREKLAGLLAGA